MNLLKLAAIIQSFVVDTVNEAVVAHVLEYHDDEDPPVPPDPPEDPPDPPDPPIEDTGLVHGVPLSGWWNGWLARGNGGGMGEKFFDHGTYGEMRNNTNAALKLPGAGNSGWDRGWFELEIKIVGQDFWPGGGGQHVLGIMSQTSSQAGPADPAMDHLIGWLRLDFGMRDGAVQPTVYQDGQPKTFNPTGQVTLDCLNKWAKLRVEWNQSPGRVQFKINGRTVNATVDDGANPIGNLLVVGNMDTNRGSRCRGDDDPCGLIGRVQYRNLRFGRA